MLTLPSKFVCVLRPHGGMQSVQFHKRRSHFTPTVAARAASRGDGAEADCVIYYITTF